MTKINKKRFLLTTLLTFIFLFGTIVSPDILSSLYLKQNINSPVSTNLSTNTIIGSSVVYAAPKASSGGFRSGSFKSTTKSSSSSGFKSGSFSSTPKSSTKSSSSSVGSSSSSNYSTRRSFIPIPIPIPWGHQGYYGSSNYGGSFISGFLKFIVFIIIIIVILKMFRRRRY